MIRDVKKDKIRKLKCLYKLKRNKISKRLKEFNLIWKKGDNTIFGELCYCVLTPQSKAEVCAGIIDKLAKSGLLFTGTEKELLPYIKKVRFYKNKTKYIIEARSFFQKNKGKIIIKNTLKNKGVLEMREWLVKNIKGIGYKEASHFLRNLGFGEDIAILDVHILKKLKEFSIIKRLPKSLTKKQYLEIEDKLRGFSKKIGIPMSSLDLLLWDMETGRIFK